MRIDLYTSIYDTLIVWFTDKIIILICSYSEGLL